MSSSDSPQGQIESETIREERVPHSVEINVYDGSIEMGANLIHNTMILNKMNRQKNSKFSHL